MWEIIDDSGTIHSGSEDEMRRVFDIMTNIDLYTRREIAEWNSEDWDGDLKLIEIHEICK